jgi:hypothetical protein
MKLEKMNLENISLENVNLENVNLAQTVQLSFGSSPSFFFSLSCSQDGTCLGPTPAPSGLGTWRAVRAFTFNFSLFPGGSHAVSSR